MAFSLTPFLAACDGQAVLSFWEGGRRGWEMGRMGRLGQGQWGSGGSGAGRNLLPLQTSLPHCLPSSHYLFINMPFPLLSLAHTPPLQEQEKENYGPQGRDRE